VNVDWGRHVAGFRAILILFLGLNVAWIETSVNAIVMKGSGALLGWPPFGWYMTAMDWFWTHFVLTILTIAVLVFSFYSYPPRRGENPQC